VRIARLGQTLREGESRSTRRLTAFAAHKTRTIHIAQLGQNSAWILAPAGTRKLAAKKIAWKHAPISKRIAARRHVILRRAHFTAAHYG
jgi:hypothetical protein